MRVYRVTDPGSIEHCPSVEYSDDGVNWRETRNFSRRMIEYYRIHRTMPPGMDSGTWVTVEPKMIAAL